jgi:hypothetical protein
VSARRSEHGGATLATAFVVLLAGSLLAAAVAEIARTELLVARDRRILARGLAAADACLARVVTDLPAGWDHETALAGADGIAGTADDGVQPAPTGCRAKLLPGPLGSVRPFLDVEITVPGGGRRLRAIVGAVPPPLPALVWAERANPLGFVTGRVELDGVDPARPDLPPLAAVGSPEDPGAVDAWFAATPAVSVVGATEAPRWAAAPPLGGILTARLGAHGAASVFAPAPSPPPVALHAVAGDLLVVTAGHGAGFLAVTGRLDIQADFAFSGIVAVSGGVRVASGATLRIAGGLWVGATGLDVAGTLVVRHDRAAADAVDALFRLPRPAAVAGLVDR